MDREPRLRHLQSCPGKVRYTAKAEAELVAKSRTRKYGRRHQAYRCTCCGDWHVGGDKLKSRRRAAPPLPRDS